MPDDLLRLHRSGLHAGSVGVGQLAANDMTSMNGHAFVCLAPSGRAIAFGAQLMEDIKDGGFGRFAESAGGDLTGFQQQLFGVGHGYLAWSVDDRNFPHIDSVIDAVTS